MCDGQETGHYVDKTLWSRSDARPDDRATCDRPLPKLVSGKNRESEAEKTVDAIP